MSHNSHGGDRGLLAQFEKSVLPFAEPDDGPQSSSDDGLSWLDVVEEAYLDTFETADDEALDEELIRLGFDPEEVTRKAVETRERLAEVCVELTRDPEEELRAQEDPHRGAAALRFGRVLKGFVHERSKCVVADPETAAGDEAEREAVAPPWRRSVVFVTAEDGVAEAAAIRGILHRLQATVGLAGRIGLRLDVLHATAFDGAAAGARVRFADEAPDLLISCRRGLTDEEEDAGFRSAFASTAGGIPRDVVVLVDLRGGAAREKRDVEAGPAVLRAASPRDLLYYEDGRELEQVFQCALARWLLDVRLELIYGGARLPHAVAPSCTTLCVSFAGAGALGPDPTGVVDSWRHLWNPIASLAGRHDGVLGGRFMDVAFFHFAGDDRHRRALEAALLLAKGTPGAWDDDRREVAGTQPLRMAVHDLPEHSPSKGSLPPGFGFLLALVERPEVDTGLTATEVVIGGLRSDQRAAFRSGGRFCGVPVWIRDPRRETIDRPDGVLSERDFHDLERYVVELEAAAAAPEPKTGWMLKSVDPALTAFYALLDSCCRRLSDQRRLHGAAPADAAPIALEVLDLERRVWTLVERLSSRSIACGGDSSWRAPVYIAAARRASLIGELERAAGADAAASRDREAAVSPSGEVIGFPGNGARTVPDVSGHLLKLVGQLLRGDELDAYTSWIELAERYKREIVGYLGNPPCRWHLEDRIRVRLWDFAPLIVAEDVAESLAGGCLILPVVAAGPLGDARFAALCRFLDDGQGACWKAEDELRSRGSAASFRDAEKLWQGRLLVTGDGDRRREAVERVRHAELWPLLTYPRTPLAAIGAIVERFAASGMERYGQVCFDCVSFRLKRALEAEDPAQETRGRVRDILQAFTRFRSSADGGRFERLEEIMDLYRRRSPGGEREARRLSRELLAGEAEARPVRHDAGDRLGALPLVVQRHLASEGRYLEHFACHPDYRIAREALRHIRPDGVERFVVLKSLNAHLLRDLLQKPGMFDRPSALETALRHPKCDPGFAHQKLPRLGKSALLRVIRDPGANPEIRGRAERFAEVRGFPPSKSAAKRAGAGGGP